MKENILFILSIVGLIGFSVVSQKKDLQYLPLEELSELLEATDVLEGWEFSWIGDMKTGESVHISVADIESGFFFKDPREQVGFIGVIQAKNRKSLPYVEKGLHFMREGFVNSWRHQKIDNSVTYHATEKTWGQISYIIMHPAGKEIEASMDKWIEESYGKK